MDFRFSASYFQNLHFSDNSKNEVLDSVHQYHFSAWPDFGVPSSSKSIVELANYVRNKLRGSNGKIKPKFFRVLAEGLILLEIKRACQKRVTAVVVKTNT